MRGVSASGLPTLDAGPRARHADLAAKDQKRLEKYRPYEALGRRPNASPGYGVRTASEAPTEDRQDEHAPSAVPRSWPRGDTDDVRGPLAEGALSRLRLKTSWGFQYTVCGRIGATRCRAASRLADQVAPRLPRGGSREAHRLPAITDGGLAAAAQVGRLPSARLGVGGGRVRFTGSVFPTERAPGRLPKRTDC
jgi:hypothetical protein